MFLPRTLAAAVDKVARQSVGKDWSLYATLLNHWQEIVGLEYAQVTTPVKVVFPFQPNEPRRRSGTLCVRLPKGLAMEFTFKTEQIRQRINGYFGYDAIAKVIFDPIYYTDDISATPPREISATAIAEIKETAQQVEDEDLRRALEDFGLAINGVASR